MQRLGDDHNAALAFERSYELLEKSEKQKNQNDLLVLVNRALFMMLQNNTDGAREHLQKFQELSSGLEISEKVIIITQIIIDILYK